MIDPHAEPVTWTFVDPGALRRSFLLTADGDALLVLAGDGRLHRYDPVTGAAAGAPLKVAEPFPTAANAPVLVIDLEHALVLDPRDASVTEIDLDAWTTTRSFTLPGPPLSGAVFGAIR